MVAGLLYLFDAHMRKLVKDSECGPWVAGHVVVPGPVSPGLATPQPRSRSPGDDFVEVTARLTQDAAEPVEVAPRQDSSPSGFLDLQIDEAGYEHAVGVRPILDRSFFDSRASTSRQIHAARSDSAAFDPAPEYGNPQPVSNQADAMPASDTFNQTSLGQDTYRKFAHPVVDLSSASSDAAITPLGFLPAGGSQPGFCSPSRGQPGLSSPSRGQPSFYSSSGGQTDFGFLSGGQSDNGAWGGQPDDESWEGQPDDEAWGGQPDDEMWGGIRR